MAQAMLDQLSEKADRDSAQNASFLSAFDLDPAAHADRVLTRRFTYLVMNFTADDEHVKDFICARLRSA